MKEQNNQIGYTEQNVEKAQQIIRDLQDRKIGCQCGHYALWHGDRGTFCYVCNCNGFKK